MHREKTSKEQTDIRIGEKRGIGEERDIVTRERVWYYKAVKQMQCKGRITEASGGHR